MHTIEHVEISNLPSKLRILVKDQSEEVDILWVGKLDWVEFWGLSGYPITRARLVPKSSIDSGPYAKAKRLRFLADSADKSTGLQMRCQMPNKKKIAMRLDENTPDAKDIETVHASDKEASDSAQRMMMLYSLELDLLK